MGLTQPITDEIIRAEHSVLWGKAEQEYGDMFKVPFDVVFDINNRLRLLNVLRSWDGSGRVSSHLSAYMIPKDIVEEYVARFCDADVVVDDSPKEKRSDKYDAFIEWSKDHVFEQFTTEQLVEVSKFSYITTLKFIQESPHFRKIKKGLWEVRDAKADREAEKNR